MTPFTDRFNGFLLKIRNHLPWRFIIPIVTVFIFIFWLTFTPGGLLGKADAVGYAVCHRIEARSFHFGNRQIPLCARCTGQYLGAVSGILFLGLVRPKRVGRPPWKIIVPLVLFVLFFAVDGLNSYLHLIPGLSQYYLYEPNNFLRLFTGTGLGLGMSVLLFPAFNEIIWKERNPAPILEGVKDFFQLISIAIIIDILVLTENPLLLYPLSLISAGGVLLLLTMVYTMVIIMIFRLDNHFKYYQQLLIPGVSGFLLALTQVFLLDYLRFLFTGTWSGFILG